MKRLLVAMLLAAPALAWAQSLLDFRNDYAFRPDTVEALAGRAYRARIDSLAADGRLDTDPRLLLRLRTALAVLDAAVRTERPDARPVAWEIHTCTRCAENASSMAGGRILVGEALVASLGLDDDELGFLVAHEMAHVLAEHAREFASVARYFVDNGRNRDFEDIQSELEQSVSVNLRMAMLGTQQELEADYIGLLLGARAGYDPQAMPALLAKLQGEPQGLFATHPAGVERIRRVRAAVETARRIRGAGLPLP